MRLDKRTGLSVADKAAIAARLDAVIREAVERGHSKPISLEMRCQDTPTEYTIKAETDFELNKQYALFTGKGHELLQARCPVSRSYGFGEDYDVSKDADRLMRFYGHPFVALAVFKRLIAWEDKQPEFEPTNVQRSRRWAIESELEDRGRGYHTVMERACMSTVKRPKRKAYHMPSLAPITPLGIRLLEPTAVLCDRLRQAADNLTSHYDEIRESNAEIVRLIKRKTKKGVREAEEIKAEVTQLETQTAALVASKAGAEADLDAAVEAAWSAMA